MAASLDWLDDDIVRLIGRCLARSPAALAALARTSRATHALLAAMLLEVKSLLDICKQAVGITDVAQLRSVGTLLFHDALSTQQISSISLALSSDVTPNLKELCFYNVGMSDDGLIALLGALVEGDGKYAHAGSAANLTMLALSGNLITGRAVEALTKAIPRFTRLRRLEIMWGPGQASTHPPRAGPGCTPWAHSRHRRPTTGNSEAQPSQIEARKTCSPLVDKCSEIYGSTFREERRARGASETLLLVVLSLRYRFGPQPAYGDPPGTQFH